MSRVAGKSDPIRWILGLLDSRRNNSERSRVEVLRFSQGGLATPASQVTRLRHVHLLRGTKER